MDFQGQLRIWLNPALYLSPVEILHGQIHVVRHECGQFFRSIGNLMLGGVVSDVQVLYTKGLVHGDVLPVHGANYLIQIPAFGRVLDEKSAAYLGQRVGHVGGNRYAALHLVDGHVLLQGLELPFAHPQRQDGHTQGVEVRLGSEFYVDAIGKGYSVCIDLRSSVYGGAHLFGGAASVLVQKIGNAEVAEHAVPVIPVLYEDVGGFHIFVQHPGLVHGVERHGSLERYRQDGLGIALYAGLCGAAFGKIFRQFEGLVVC